MVYNSVPRVGSSRGAERDPHLSSRTSKGSCTFRAREERRRAGRGSRIFPGNVRPGGGTHQPPLPRGFLSRFSPAKPSVALSPSGGASLPASPPLPGASPLLLFLSLARRSGEGARVRGGGERDLPASGTCSPGPVGRFSPGPARDYRPHMALRPGA